MRIARSLAAAAVLAVAVSAQSPLTTLYSGGNGGAAEWTNFFNLTPNVGLAVTQFDLNVSSAVGTPGTIDVYLTAPGGSYSGNEFNAGAWTLAMSSSSFTSNGPGVATSAILTAPILLSPGQIGVAVRYRGVAMSYTNGTGANQVYSNTELTLSAGSSSSSTSGPFTGGINNPRVWNGAVHYLVGSGFARATAYGTGCGAGAPATMYERFDGTTNVVDLSNAAYQMLWIGNGYIVLPSLAPLVTPTAGQLTLTDDSITTVSLPWPFPTQNGNVTSVSVGSNGYVHWGTSSFTGYTESLALMLSNPSGVYGLWDDLNPAAGGTVHAEQDPIDPTQFHITWLGVYEYATANPNTFQITLSQFGNVDVVYGTLTSRDAIAGYSKGAGATNPVAVDLSAVNGHTIGNGNWTLTMTSVARPVMGQTGIVRTNGIQPGSVGGVIGYGVTQTSFDLSILGMTGCTQYATLDATLQFATPSATADHPLPIPIIPSIVGASLFLQSFVVTPGANPFNVVATNGMQWVLDVN